MTAPMAKPPALPSAMVGLRHSRNGSIGAGLWRSRRTSVASAPTPTARQAANIHGLRLPPWIIAIIKAPPPSISRTDARKSMRGGRGCGRSWKNAASMAKARAPTGRLIQKTIDQLACSTRKAPRVGPTMAAKPKTLERKPWTRARSVGE